MSEAGKRLFIGIKISAALQNDINSPAPGTERYFQGNNGDYLQIINLGEDKFIGRYINDGYPVTAIADVSRNVCSIIKLIARGRRIEESEVHIYSA
ncbi:MAG TPA: hypothetical protein VHM64_14825 [Candidatus Binatia bacterium]|nr:hypothetical protein [Candidatus Binatia bacterium]